MKQIRIFSRIYIRRDLPKEERKRTNEIADVVRKRNSERTEEQKAEYFLVKKLNQRTRESIHFRMKGRGGGRW